MKYAARISFLGVLLFAGQAVAEQTSIGWLRQQFLTPYSEAFLDAAPVPAQLVAHDIDDFGTCQFFAKRGVRWRQSFADGSRLELRCEPVPGSLLPGFHLWYVKDRGARFEIGRCVFDNGFNEGVYYTSIDPAVKGPVRVEWVNVDGGKNDGGGRHLDDQNHVTGPEEPYLDVVRYSFDPAAGRLDCVSDKYDYAVASGLPKRPQSLQGLVGAPEVGLRRTFVTYLQ